MPEAPKNQETQEIQGPALGNVLADPRTRGFFLSMAPHWQGAGRTLAHKLMQRYEGSGEADASSAVDAGDATATAERDRQAKNPNFDNVEILLLREMRSEYLRRTEMVAEAQKLCTPDVVEHIASQDPTLGAIVELMQEQGSAEQGVDKIHQIITSQIESMAFGEELVHFENFVATLQRVAAMEAQEKTLASQIQGDLKKYGVSSEQYEAVVNTGDRQLQEELLQKVVHEQKGFFGRLLQQRSRNQAADLFDAEMGLKDLQTQTDMELGQLGEIFSMLTKGHDTIRQQLSNAILEVQPGAAGGPEHVGDFGEEFGEMRAQVPALRNYDALWDTMKGEYDYDNLGHSEQQQVKDWFLNEQFAHRPGKGLWQTAKAFVKNIWAGI